ncbi:MAG: PilZ domain-containing protein, partial [Nannocystaceae bacterium]
QPLADLSLGGCCIHGPSIESCGSEVDLTFVFQGDASTISLRGSVVRVADDETGIQFGKLEDDQKWAIRKQIRAMAQALRRS